MWRPLREHLRSGITRSNASLGARLFSAGAVVGLLAVAAFAAGILTPTGATGPDAWHLALVAASGGLVAVGLATTGVAVIRAVEDGGR